MKTSVIIIGVIACVIFTPSSAFTAHLFGPEALDTTFGGYFRLRHEVWDNCFTFNAHLGAEKGGFEDAHLFRLKTSGWMKNDFGHNFGLMVQLTNEARYFVEHTKNDDGFYGDELFVDNLYFYSKDIFGLPVDVSIGRQNFIMKYGEGFLIMDGTGEDGSRSFYFNAALVTLKFSPNHSLDLIFITNGKTDAYLPSLYPAEKRVTNPSDERGIVFYFRNKISDSILIEPYYIYKEEEIPQMLRGIKDTDLSLHTIGFRGVLDIKDYRLRGEYAHQFGKYRSGRNRNANGGYLFLNRTYKNVFLQPGWEIGGVYLSGDNPDTDEDEGWDPLFSKFAWLSEMFLFTLTTERGAGYWTNLEWYRFGINFTFPGQTDLQLSYNYVRADEAKTGNPFATDKGRERGQMTIGKLTHKFSKAIDGYIMLEHFIPGDHYKYSDNALFMRWELMFKF